jgi:hypothetical protein
VEIVRPEDLSALQLSSSAALRDAMVVLVCPEVAAAATAALSAHVAASGERHVLRRAANSSGPGGGPMGPLYDPYLRAPGPSQDPLKPAEQ